MRARQKMGIAPDNESLGPDHRFRNVDLSVGFSFEPQLASRAGILCDEFAPDNPRRKYLKLQLVLDH